MNLYQWFLSLRKKTVEPMVYAVVFRSSRNGERLFLTADYMLDDVYPRFIETLTEEERRQDWKPLMWQSETFMRLASPFADQKLTDVSPEQVSKNMLMQKIVASKDKKLFEKNKELFTEVEVKYLETEINK